MEKATFEEKMQQLEALTRQLESGEEPIGTMVGLYEQGMALYRALNAELAEYEKRLAALSGEEA